MDTSDIAEARSTLKAVCTRKDLLEGVQTVGHAVSGRTSLPILSHILIESEGDRLRLSATDMEIGVSLTIPARIEEGGAMTAPSRLLTELVNSLPEKDVTVSVDRSHAARLHCERSDYKLVGLPAEEYPHLPEVRDDNRFAIPQRALRDVIKHTVFAVSTDETRAILTGVLAELEGNVLRLVATDTHRLAMRLTAVTDGHGSHQAILPARALNELSRMLEDADGDVQVRVSENQALFSAPNGVTLVTRLIEGQFPNYQRVIPTAYTKRLTVQTQPLLQAVRRASIVARNAAHRIVLKTLEDRLVITAESSMEGNAYEEVEVACEGEDVEIAFNAKYLLDVLTVLDSEGIFLDVTEALKPGVVRPVPADDSGDEEYLCVLMPMQIV